MHRTRLNFPGLPSSAALAVTPPDPCSTLGNSRGAAPPLARGEARRSRGWVSRGGKIPGPVDRGARAGKSRTDWNRRLPTRQAPASQAPARPPPKQALPPPLPVRRSPRRESRRPFFPKHVTTVPRRRVPHSPRALARLTASPSRRPGSRRQSPPRREATLAVPPSWQRTTSPAPGAPPRMPPAPIARARPALGEPMDATRVAGAATP